MVRRMKLTGRTGALAICVLVVVAAAGLLGAHVFRTSQAPAGLRCPQDPGVALGWDEPGYRAISMASVPVSRGRNGSRWTISTAYTGWDTRSWPSRMTICLTRCVTAMA